MRDHAKKYRCASAIYLLSYIDLDFIIIIDLTIGAPWNGEYAVYVINDRDKHMPK